MSESLTDDRAPRVKKPPWLKVKLPTGKKYTDLKAVVEQNGLHTICQSGNCPNMGECWGAGTATFMILGNICPGLVAFVLWLRVDRWLLTRVNQNA